MRRDLKVLFTSGPSFIVWANGGVQVEATVPPVALYTLASVVENEGFCCSILDPVDYWRIYRDDALFYERVQGYDVVCVSGNSTTWPVTIPLLKKFASMKPRPLIIAGGLHATYCDDHIIRTTPVDIIVRGEGERTIALLLHAISLGESIDGIQGLTFRKNGSVIRTTDLTPLTCKDLSESPLPQWEKLPPMAYGFIPIEISRGCRFGWVRLHLPDGRKHPQFLTFRVTS